MRRTLMLLVMVAAIGSAACYEKPQTNEVCVDLSEYLGAGWGEACIPKPA
jgi:hypothetical protein